MINPQNHALNSNNYKLINQTLNQYFIIEFKYNFLRLLSVNALYYISLCSNLMNPHPSINTFNIIFYCSISAVAVSGPHLCSRTSPCGRTLWETQDQSRCL